MNRYEEKLMRMETHLQMHPNDYQTVISRLKTKSSLYAYKQTLKRNKMLKEIAKYRRQT